MRNHSRILALRGAGARGASATPGSWGMLAPPVLQARAPRGSPRLAAAAAGSLGWLLALLATFTTLHSPAAAQVRPEEPRLPWLRDWSPPQVPTDYRSPAGPHKVIVPNGDVSTLAPMGTIRPLAELQYAGQRLYLVSHRDLERLPGAQPQRIVIQDRQNLIRLRDRFFDTTVPVPAVRAGLAQVPRPGRQLYLVQFTGPVRDEWLAELRELRGLEIVTYIPENAYLVWADQGARGGLAARVRFQPHVQWTGPFHPAYKLHPGFDPDFAGEVDATIQLFTHEGAAASLQAIRGMASRVLKEPRQVDVFTNLTVRIPASRLEAVARLEDVVNVEPFTPVTPYGERQGQILAGNLNAAGTGADQPGYLAWLNRLGFTRNFDFAIDITDDGFDRGETTAANVHPDFLDAGGNSRVAYVRRVNGTTVFDSNDNNTGGHGTINASIAAGWNNTASGAADFRYFGDGAGYRYGLGIAPFARLGSTNMFYSPLLTTPPPDFTTIIDAAYSGTARVSNNSWGANPRRVTVNGSYDAISQEYDRLVRDARPAYAPSGGAPGNQEMVIVFAAGNEGRRGRSTIGNTGGAAKNTITVGASEMNDATGVADGNRCGIGDVGANDINQVIIFSSQGPTADGRVKPDIMAPGTHVFGAASQDASFTGSSVCGGPTNDGFAPAADAYYPADPNTSDTRAQTLYTWSSGTSHAAPAVAGGAALLRQWFLDHGHPAPSPAMTKAYLMNSATYMTGPADNLYSNVQGMGRANLGMAFDNAPRLLFDQVGTAHGAAAGAAFTVTGRVVDATRPFRVTMAYTDAPGSPVSGVIRNNDLDLTVQVGGNTYRGNRTFTQGLSNPGAATPDQANNVESVFLPAGTTGDFTVTVTPTNTSSDGVPGNGDATDQDFALVVYNGDFPLRNPVDIILVLDVSGSMTMAAPGGTMTKIDLLKDAVEMFVRAWEPFSIPGDRMGVVFFSDGIARTIPAAGPVLLQPFQANAAGLIAGVRAQPAGGCTALGGGILTALRGFDTAPDRQRHIVVFTNGMQNVSPLVTATGSAHQIVADAGAECGESGIPGAPGINLADYGVKAIHTIGTGVSGASWTSLLTEIANETGGKNHFTAAPDENLEDFFLETLVAALRVDPVEKVASRHGTLTNADAGRTETFQINASVRKATFALSWQGERSPRAVAFSLIAPDGKPVPSEFVTVRSGPFYLVVSLDFPMVAKGGGGEFQGLPIGTRVPHAGTWRMVLHPTLAVAWVGYRAHLIVDDADLRYSLDVPTAGTAVGDPIPISLSVQQGNRTLTGLTGVRATVTRPEIGLGTWMVRHPVSPDQLGSLPSPSGDRFASLADRKAFVLLQDAGLRRELDPVTETIDLFDDGLPQHGDAKEGDGVYSGLYTSTQRPGHYGVDLSFGVVQAAGGTAVRTDSRTLSVTMQRFDPAKSTVRVRRLGARAYHVTVIPLDRYDNYLGPGHRIEAVVVLPGDKFTGRRVLLTDNLDGSYSGRVQLTPAEAAVGAEVRVDIGGRPFVLAPPPPPAQGRFWISAHAGVSVPRGDFDAAFDPGLLADVGVGYRFAGPLALEAVLGRYGFTPSYHVVGGTLYLEGFVPVGGARLIPAVGAGVYKPRALDAAFGVSPGIGLDWPLSLSLRGEVAAHYFHLFSAGDDITFLGLRAGLKLVF